MQLCLQSLNFERLSIFQRCGLRVSISACSSAMILSSAQLPHQLSAQSYRQQYSSHEWLHPSQAEAWLPHIITASTLFVACCKSFPPASSDINSYVGLNEPTSPLQHMQVNTMADEMEQQLGRRLLPRRRQLLIFQRCEV